MTHAFEPPNDLGADERLEEAEAASAAAERGWMQMRTVLGRVALLVGLCAACGSQTAADAGTPAEASAHNAHEAYVTAINSNNLESLLGMLTEDVVFLSAPSP